MATVMNSRDVYLQAYSPRVEEVTLSDNITVGTDQVEGLGLVLAGIKTIRLSGSTQVFQIPKSGSVSPASVTITAVVTGMSGVPTISVVSGSLSSTPTLVGMQATIPYADFLTDTVTLRATLVSESVSYTDDLTIVKVREGDDSLNAFLTNESHTVPADSLGNVTSYATANGQFKVYRGIYDVSSSCTFGLAVGGNPAGLVYTIDTAGNYAVTGGMGVLIDQATITFTATFLSTTLSKVFSITKSKAGSNGTDGDDGTNGQRGSMTFYVPIAGTVFDETLATTTASVYGGPILNDVVTQYNSGAGFSETRFYNGTSWLVVNAVVDGNLLVTGSVSTNKITANAITTALLAANAVTAEKFAGGMFEVGKYIASTNWNGVIDVDGNITTPGTTGWIMAAGDLLSELEVNAGRIGGAVIDGSGIESDSFSATAGWRLDNATGKITARNIEINDGADERIFDLTATGSEYVLKVDDVFYIDADGNMTINALDVIDTVNVAPGALSASYADSNSSATSQEFTPTPSTTTAASISVVSPGGVPLHLNCWTKLSYVWNSAGNGPQDLTVKIVVKEGSSVLYEEASTFFQPANQTGEGSLLLSRPFVTTPAAGTTVYSVVIESSAEDSTPWSSNVTVAAGNSVLAGILLKR